MLFGNEPNEKSSFDVVGTFDENDETDEICALDEFDGTNDVIGAIDDIGKITGIDAPDKFGYIATLFDDRTAKK